MSVDLEYDMFRYSHLRPTPTLSKSLTKTHTHGVEAKGNM